jgi:transcriptional regulator with XRE-family HTH domain
MPPNFRRLPKHFGDTVRELRKAEGLSQMTLAEKAELTLNYVGEVERGEKLASLETIVRLAMALEMSGGELLTKAKI